MSKFQLAVVALVAGAVAFGAVHFLERLTEEPNQRSWESAITLKDVHAAKPFSATVQAIRYGAKDPTAGGTFEYIVIILETAEGKKVALYEKPATTNISMLAASLIVGKQYEFPTALFR